MIRNARCLCFVVVGRDRRIQTAASGTFGQILCGVLRGNQILSSMRPSMCEARPTEKTSDAVRSLYMFGDCVELSKAIVRYALFQRPRFHQGLNSKKCCPRVGIECSSCMLRSRGRAFIRDCHVLGLASNAAAVCFVSEAAPSSGTAMSSGWHRIAAALRIVFQMHRSH